MMLSLKLVRSLVLGETINNPLLLAQSHHYHDDLVSDDDDDDDDDPHLHVQPLQLHRRSGSRSSRSAGRRKSGHSGKNSSNTKTPLLLFLPTREIIRDTYRLATIARDMGMDLYPSPSLSHIIFSWPSLSSLPSLWSSSSSSWSTSADIIPLPFPSLSNASAVQLRSFVCLSKGLFKLVFCSFSCNSFKGIGDDGDSSSNWDCCSLSLYSRLSGDRIDSMDGFSRALAGVGWTLFKTKNNPSLGSSGCGFRSVKSVYLFRKVVANKVRAKLPNGGTPVSGEFRIRELRLPPLDFRNAPLRILQYIILMTDDLFYLA
ncbi:PREDICTED: uncharacterized protein LOC104587547 [Nelumbo nucifera]|uniref:Uncharacterized protein LOC104587547 n=1 Tax=Nelumbo nucifera TaxID=4432 RepID=A0A1U7Z8V1_NELNU|nr:PREDICTED: uncharacterized protein LOC104587547 [Nelumbo nucifera]